MCAQCVSVGLSLVCLPRPRPRQHSPSLQHLAAAKHASVAILAAYVAALEHL